MGKPILCLDFDGVIHSYTSGWQGAQNIPDPPVPGALEFLVSAVEHFEVHIFSSRTHQDGVIAMYKWLAHHLHLAGRDERDAYDFATKVIKWPEHKPPAMITIDDRALTFTGEWPRLDELLAFKPWNKR